MTLDSRVIYSPVAPLIYKHAPTTFTTHLNIELSHCVLDDPHGIPVTSLTQCTHSLTQCTHSRGHMGSKLSELSKQAGPWRQEWRSWGECSQRDWYQQPWLAPSHQSSHRTSDYRHEAPSAWHARAFPTPCASSARHT